MSKRALPIDSRALYYSKNLKKLLHRRYPDHTFRAGNHKLIQGRGNNRFAPGEFATRAEALKIVLNLQDYLKNVM
ncbi:S-layer homology domain-containing protein [Paenibacillus sp. FJAT-27812]|uniref:S-layer homology domain-containing protein n=1 Tax=Paenibacillus sp. FJAT-27812 TaxID=1684143 RepID=UPI0006A75998|nr:S-layer homology domain-containing protein [Paenibacillus sp. FJAT-27812]